MHCPADDLLLRALATEYHHALVTVELLRARTQGLIMAASLIAEQGAHGRDFFRGVQRVSEGLRAADHSKRALEEAVVAAEEIDTNLVLAYQRALADTTGVRDVMLDLCFTATQVSAAA